MIFKDSFCDVTKEMLSKLKKRNILGEDGCYSAIPLSASLSKGFSNSKTPVLLDCVITRVEETSKGYIIEYFTERGFVKIKAKQIIDTTDIGIFGELANVPKKYYLANLVDYKKDAKNLVVLKGHLKDEYYLKVAANGLDFIKAREKTMKIAKENGLKIAAFSPVFAYDYKYPYLEKKGKNYILCPSAAFENFSSAFDFGVKGACLK